jgi:hypothetical protein
MPPANTSSVAARPRSRSRANQHLLQETPSSLSPRSGRFSRLSRRSAVERRARPAARGGNGFGSGGELPSASKEVERAIDYLATVRLCRSPEESLRLAVRAGFHSGEDWLELFEQQPKCDDFVLDTMFLRVQETSYLRAGGVFWGEQVAPSACSVPGSQWSVKVSVESIEYSQLRLSRCTLAFRGWVICADACAQRGLWRRLRTGTGRQISRRILRARSSILISTALRRSASTARSMTTQTIGGN